MLTLINQVLDFSKIEAGHISLDEKSFDLYSLLNDVIDMLKLKAEKKLLALVFEKSPDISQYVRADESKLKQVLVNLIGNAVKFTSKGFVTVRIKKKEYERKSLTQTLCFEIEDTGPGISPGETDTLFKPFVQTDTGRQHQEGTGLGLSISRRFIQLMGGDIAVRSEPGKGTLFFFEIKVHVISGEEIVSKAKSRRPATLESGQPTYKLLIVDDTSDTRNLFVNILQPFGFELREAENGREAVDIWQDWRPHLIWMDIRMPVMNGYEAVNMIRRMETAHETEEKTVIIAQTASSFEEDRKKIIEAGCDDFLRKPFKEFEIFELMRRHLGISYVYESIKEESSEHSRQRPAEIIPEMISGIPDLLLKKLKEAAVNLDVERIERIIEEIRLIHSEFADWLKGMNDDFEYNKIIQMVEDIERKAA